MPSTTTGGAGAVLGAHVERQELSLRRGGPSGPSGDRTSCSDVAAQPFRHDADFSSTEYRRAPDAGYSLVLLLPALYPVRDFCFYLHSLRLR